LRANELFRPRPAFIGCLSINSNSNSNILVRYLSFLWNQDYIFLWNQDKRPIFEIRVGCENPLAYLTLRRDYFFLLLPPGVIASSSSNDEVQGKRQVAKRSIFEDTV